MGTYNPLYFKQSEVRCKCGKCAGASRDGHLTDPLLIRLDLLRTIIDAPIAVTSGRRCEAHNRASGGAERSYHLHGRAADVTSADVGKLFEAAVRLDRIYLYKFTELIKYPQRGFLHCAV